MAYATPEDILTRWIGGDPPEEAIVSALIADASTLIRFEFPDIDDRIDAPAADGGVPADRLTLVVSRMVIRALRNPDNIRRSDEGPFGATYAGDQPGGLVITSDDRSMLSGLVDAVGMQAFTIDPTPTVDPGYLGGSYCEDWWWGS